MIFLSHSQDSKKNPLDYETKLTFLTKCGFCSIISTYEIKKLFDIFKKLESEKYEKVIFVVGEDRVKKITKSVVPYINKGGENSLSFDFVVRSVGRRNPYDDETIEGISSTKMRNYVKNNDYKSFIRFLPSTVTEIDSKKLWDVLQCNMYRGNNENI